MTIARIGYNLCCLALAAAVLAGCATDPSVSAEGDSALAAKYGVMARGEINDRIISNTLVGRSHFDDKEWVEYYLPGGEIIGRAMDGSESWSGYWKVSGPVMCWNYQGAHDDHCNLLRLDGDRVTFVDTDGSAAKERPATLFPGNAYRLVGPGSE